MKEPQAALEPVNTSSECYVSENFEFSQTLGNEAEQITALEEKHAALVLEIEQLKRTA